MLADVPFEKPRVSNHGRLVRPATKWVDRILGDTRSIKETVDGADDLLEELDERWMRLFCCRGAYKDDHSELKTISVGTEGITFGATVAWHRCILALGEPADSTPETTALA